MTRLLILAASLGLAISQAAACDFHQTTASKVDETKVASITTNQTQNMSKPASQSTDSTVIVKKEAAQPAQAE